MFNKPIYKFIFLIPLLLLAFLFLNGRSPQPVEAAAVRIMPLGDSITGSPGCWRAILWNQLQDNGYTDIDFVGTLPPQGCALAHDGDNEGHGGYLATNVANQNQLVSWLDATNPDIVLMHFGTNDAWSNIPTQTILDAFTTLVSQMRDNNPNMIVLAAQIIPMDPDRSCSECDQRVIALNNAIPAWASGLSTSQSPIIVVDHWTGFDTATDTYDGVHPNDAGDQKMADAWYAALSQVLSGDTPTPVPTTPPDITPSATAVLPTNTPVPPTSTPGTGGYCTVDYAVANSWSNVFQANVTITNQSSATIAGWTLEFTHAAGQTATGGWNADISQSGNQVTVSNPASYWNGTIGANGGSVTFGLQGTFTGSVVIPTDYAVNGTACNGNTPLPTNTPVPPTATAVPPTATLIPEITPTATSVPPTATSIPPTATAIPPTSTSVPPTATPGTGFSCSVDYVVQQEWGNGFIGNVTIGVETAVSGWTLEFDFPADQTISNMWGGLYAQSGSAVTVVNEGWNGTIGANGTTSFGFQANFSNSNEVPTAFTLNGSPCN